MPPKTKQKRNKAPISGDAMADCVFAEEILLSILTRLPVKSILRFKSVCKPLFNLFSTPHFIKTHHHHFSQHSKNEAVVIYNPSVEDDHIHIVSLFNVESSDEIPANIDHPLPVYDLELDFVGCIDGLICLSNYPPVGDFVYIWNPAMNLCKHVKLPKVDVVKDELVSIGFGYDAVGDDFKVVRIVFSEDGDENKGKRSEVYSANSDSWTTIDAGFEFSVSGTRNDAIVNGNPYWVAKC